MVEETRDLSGLSLIKVHIPLRKVPFSWPKDLSKAPPENMDIRFSTYEYCRSWENTNIPAIASTVWM